MPERAPKKHIKRCSRSAGRALFSSLSERLRQSDEVIESLLHREVSTRLSTLPVNLGERFGDGAGVLIDVRLTHQDLAKPQAAC